MDSPLKRYRERVSGLRKERSSWVAHWRELADYILPRKYIYLAEDTSRGNKRNSYIINNTASIAVRTLAAGMMAGITSPARPWFRMTTSDPDLSEYGQVREWLDIVVARIREAIAKSNIYNCLHQYYVLLGTFGTACMLIDEDAHDGLRGYVFPMGQYMIAVSARQAVDTVAREFSMTVGQMAEAFGEDKLSPGVKDQLKNNHLDNKVSVSHIIEPNRDYAHGVMGPKGMRFKSCWYETKTDDTAGFLREAGYEDFPAMVARWDVTEGDVYGSSPGMDALGDVKALQQLERNKAKAVDRIVTPPMKGPTALMNMRVSLMPGDMTYVDANAPGQTLAPAIEIPPASVQVAEASILEHAQRIRETLYANLWLAVTESQKNDMTAREVAELSQEKMLQLGPVMERLEDELLDPLIDRIFGIELRNGRIPPPPPEVQHLLSGQSLKIEYISIMAQAQKALGTAGLEREAGFLGNLAGVNQEVLDVIDFDELVRTHADNLGIPARIVKPKDVVEQIRKARAQAQQQQAQMQQALAMAQGAQTLSQADTSGDNALTRVINTMTPAGGLQ